MSFDDRQRAFEKKYEKDVELQFKVNARRNKLLGVWAAGLMGITGVAAESYGREIVAADFSEPGDGDVVRKVLQDLTEHGISMTEHRIRAEMDRLASVAKQQIMQEV
ncbi:MAG: DUF1476 domain-containing protein [Alphaproteobacteria bacterium]